MRFGVNYVPSRWWWHIWQDWQPDSVQQDFVQLAELGIDHLRMHCLWHLFQPNPNRVSSAALQRLEQMLDFADQCGLDLEVTVLNGWLSGFAFYPAWKTPIPDAPGLNLFTDPTMRQAQKLLFSSLANAIGQHPRFLGFDLGNELSVLQYGDDRTSLEHADAWQKDLFLHLEQIAPNKFHVNGVDHQPWFAHKAFSRHALASLGSATSLHMWVEFTGALQRYTPLQTGSLHLAEFGIEFAKAFAQDPNRPVWLQEFGASSRWMPAQDIPHFAQATMRHAATCANLWGMTWWCSHDLPDDLHGFHPLEYDLGLFDRHGRIKPVGESLREFIAEYKHHPPEPLSRPMALVLHPSDLETSEQVWAVATRFFSLLESGIRPCFVLTQNTTPSQLVARGITSLI
jgi:endo-1,4-beta-mannosidase